MSHGNSDLDSCTFYFFPSQKYRTVSEEYCEPTPVRECEKVWKEDGYGGKVWEEVRCLSFSYVSLEMFHVIFKNSEI